MRWIQSSVVAALAFLVGCGQLGGGDSGWIEVEETTESYDEEYMSVDGINYTISSKRWESSWVFRYSDGDTFSDSDVDTYLPDSNKGEYDRIRLGRRGETIVLTFEYRYVNEDGTVTEHKRQSDLELVSGTWADYAAGKDLTVRFTDEGHQQLMDEIRSELFTDYEQSLTDTILEEASSEGIDANSVAIKCTIEKFESVNTPFTLSRSKIKWGKSEPETSIFKAWITIG